MSKIKLYSALADTYSKTNADKRLAERYNKESWTALCSLAEKAVPEAIIRLYDHAIGGKSAAEMNQFLDALLSRQIQAVSPQHPEYRRAKTWLLTMFNYRGRPSYFLSGPETGSFTSYLP